MKPTDLMIGNYFHTTTFVDGARLPVYGIVFKVAEITMQGIKHSLPTGKESYFFNWNEIEPIPIDEDQLFKLGFDFVGNEIYVLSTPTEENVYYYLGRQVFVCGSMSETHISARYVHQMQNIYKTITKNDLRYKDEGKPKRSQSAQRKIYQKGAAYYKKLKHK